MLEREIPWVTSQESNVMDISRKKQTDILPVACYRQSSPRCPSGQACSVEMEFMTGARKHHQANSKWR